MTNDSAAISRFDGLFGKPVEMKFDSENRTSDGGASLLGAIDRRTKLTETLRKSLVGLP